MIRTCAAALASTVVFSLAAGPALALSCMAPDVTRSYQQAAEAAEIYVVVEGVLNHQVTTVPEGRTDSDPPLEFEADFSGTYLTKEGFSEPFAGKITVALNCLSVWCAPLPPAGSQVLAFVRQDPEGLFLDAQPCQQNIFLDPTPEQIARVETCHAGGACEGTDL